jgi:hypothetical protein
VETGLAPSALVWFYLVNDALQKQLASQRTRLKLPDNVGGLKVEHGELVLPGNNQLCFTNSPCFPVKSL